MIFEHEVVGDCGRNDDEIALLRGQRGVNQSNPGRLQLAAVAAAAFGIEEQIVLLDDLGDVRLEGDQVRRILGVAADGNRPGHVAVEETEGAAEQVDAGRDERRADAVVVEHQRFDEVVGMALVIRRVDDPVRAGRRSDMVQVLVLPLDLAQDRIERVLQRPVDRISLLGLQLIEISVNPIAGRRRVRPRSGGT